MNRSNQDDPSDNPIANMEGLQSAIVNGERERVKELLGEQTLHELQADYLIDLARLNNREDIVTLIQKASNKH